LANSPNSTGGWNEWVSANHGSSALSASRGSARRGYWRSFPNDRLDELRGRDREKRCVRLARYGPSEQRFAGARRAGQQHAVGHAPTQAPVSLGVTQEIDNLG
jgi:hypothetical protein